MYGYIQHISQHFEIINYFDCPQKNCKSTFSNKLELIEHLQKHENIPILMKSLKSKLYKNRLKLKKFIGIYQFTNSTGGDNYLLRKGVFCQKCFKTDFKENHRCYKHSIDRDLCFICNDKILKGRFWGHMMGSRCFLITRYDVKALKYKDLGDGRMEPVRYYRSYADYYWCNKRKYEMDMEDNKDIEDIF